MREFNFRAEGESVVIVWRSKSYPILEVALGVIDTDELAIKVAKLLNEDVERERGVP